MSRKITKESVNAFLSGTPFKKSNMEVERYGDMVYLRLHGNAIARYFIKHSDDASKNTIEITDAGWATVTTKERLNGLQGVSIYQKKGFWYLNGRKLEGEDYERQGYGYRLKWTAISYL